MTARGPITPETRVASLLEDYPHLEEVLMQQAPVFKALRNPILRRTVARVATLRKAADMGGIPVRQLILSLRQAAGLQEEDGDVEGAGSGEGRVSADPEARPDWLDPERVRVTLDADSLLERGEIPVTRVQEALQELVPGELACVRSQFRPVPLVEALKGRGFRVFVTEESPASFHTYATPATPTIGTRP